MYSWSFSLYTGAIALVSNFSFVYALSTHFASSSSVKSDKNLPRINFALSLYVILASDFISSPVTVGKLSGTNKPPSFDNPCLIASAEVTDIVLSLVL